MNINHRLDTHFGHPVGLRKWAKLKGLTSDEWKGSEQIKTSPFCIVYRETLGMPEIFDCNLRSF
jgi:hypothetical protein